MRLVPVLTSIAGDRTLTRVMPKLNELLAKVAVEATVKVGDARNLLAGALGAEQADRIITDLFGDGDLTAATVFKLWGRLFPGEMTEEQVKLISTRLDALDPAVPTEIRLQLMETGAEINDPPSSRVDLVLQAGSGIGIDIRGCASLPGAAGAIGAAANDCGLVRLGLDGTIAGMGALGYSFAPVSVAAGGGASYAHSVGYFLRGSPEATLGQIAVRGLGLIAAHPAFRVRSLIDMLTHLGNRVEAIEVRSRQCLRFSGGVGLARQFGSGGGNGLDAGIRAGFSLLDSGEFEYSMTVVENGLQVAIRKLRGSETTVAESIGVELDLSGLAGQLYPRIQDRLGTADKALGELLQMLPATDAVRTILCRQLDKALDGFEYKDALIAAVGIDPAMTVEARLSARLGELMAQAPALWNDKSEATAASLVESALGRLEGLTPEVRARLKAALVGRVRTALGSLDTEIKEKVREAVTGGEYQRLVQALQALGDTVSGAITSVDGKVAEVAARLRAYVGRYQAFIAKVGTYFESAAARRVTLKLGAELNRLRSEEADIRLLFNPDSPRADDYLRRLLLSDVESVFAEAVKSDAAGPVRSLNSASLARYAALKKSELFELVLFGFEMGNASILDTETTIVEDALGNLVIGTRMNLQEIMTTLRDKRCFNVVNVYQLANAGRTGTASMAFSVYREAAGLDAGDVRDFARSAARLGMVSEEDMAGLDQVMAPAGQLDFSRSRVNLGLTLTEAQLAQLIGYGSPVADPRDIDRTLPRLCDPAVASMTAASAGAYDFPGSGHPAMPTEAIRPLRADEVMNIAARAFDRTLAVVEPDEPDRKLLGKLFKESGFEGGVGEAIRDFKSIGFVTEEAPGFPLGRARDWLYYRHKAVSELAQSALLGMWAVYHSGPHRWSVDRYERCQERIGDVFGYWFDRAGSQLWLFGLNKQMRPVTLALLRTLLDLADTDPAAPGPLLSMDIQLLNDEGRVAETLPIAT